MRKTIHLIGLALVVIFTTSRVKAQTMLDSIIVEKYHIATVSDTVGRPGLKIGAVTYRIYVDMNNTNGAQLQMIYSDDNHALYYKSTTSFYNDMDKGAETGDAVRVGSLFDTYISFGGTSKTTVGVYGANDANATPQPTGTIGFDGDIITNVLNTQSGSGTDFDFQPGTSVAIYDNTAGKTAKGSTVENRVLIGQFTTDGTFSYSFALLLTDGNIQEVWVASDATTNVNGQVETANSSLSGIFVPNAAPTISITTSLSATAGDAIKIDATATDDNKVSKVEFFVDGTSIGSSTIVPYTSTWTATTGTHSITAVATDNDGVSTTSTASSIVVSAIPTLSVSSTTANIVKEGTASSITVNSNVAWTAIATDTWLTITPSTGTGNGTFTVSATANTGAARTSTVTVSATGITSQVITVTQADGTSVTPIITLSTPSTTTLSYTANSTATFDITSNSAWTVTSNVNWLTVSPASGTNNGTATLTASSNIGSATRTAIITVTSGSVSKTITITQEGTTAVAEIKSDNLVISPNPAKAFFTINSLGTANVLIYSLTGELVLNTSVSSDEKININSLSAGLYLIKIITNSSEQTHKLIVK